jgi:hypothetical protein
MGENMKILSLLIVMSLQLYSFSAFTNTPEEICVKILYKRVAEAQCKRNKTKYPNYETCKEEYLEKQSIYTRCVSAEKRRAEKAKQCEEKTNMYNAIAQKEAVTKRSNELDKQSLKKYQTLESNLKKEVLTIMKSGGPIQISLNKTNENKKINDNKLAKAEKELAEAKKSVEKYKMSDVIINKKIISLTSKMKELKDKEGTKNQEINKNKEDINKTTKKIADTSSLLRKQSAAKKAAENLRNRACR